MALNKLFPLVPELIRHEVQDGGADYEDTGKNIEQPSWRESVFLSVYCSQVPLNEGGAQKGPVVICG